ncbi:N-acetylmuramoyl-L-alanine amidase [Rufibacter quisquiliarum]|uniref:N-acetylmuramoyl-L-alanine amidase n=1 Tax=Rufibacter quisquiliarum TaxID=1549639 RepID=A0A839GMI9_9BACT|nr:N-acetylmuramoyl-L-alanine amidase [Rufibacter quisquiliarum]MBA9076765.1 N-acetylmuramoyl-L-alanine amidase [Rufibacter quisquiliarum]
MKRSLISPGLFLLAAFFLNGCSQNPYATTNKVYKKQVKTFAKTLRATPVTNPGEDTLQQGDYWVGTTNFSMRKPNYVVIHHTAQNSTDQTLKTFTMPKTQVSAHYVIGRDGKVYHMLHDYLRAWHGGNARWGTTTDLNSTSIGIELDNNGYEPFQEAQISSLLKVLAILKKTHGIPAANFIGHSDIAPSRKVDPNPTFPWKRLAEAGFGVWYDEAELEKLVFEQNLVQDSTMAAGVDSLATTGIPSAAPKAHTPLMVFTENMNQALSDTIPASFNPRLALRVLGYDTRNLEAAVKAFKLHYVQTDLTATLTERDLKILYSLYRKLL